MRVLFTAFLFFAQISEAHALTDSPEWHSLLHYQKSLSGNWVSESGNSGFFITKRGREDPEGELQASIAAMKDHQANNQPFRCTFPARYQYLKNALHLNLIDQPCPKLDEWKSRFEAQSATIAFATAYLGNVASAFGHTFLKINSSSGIKRENDLLDFGLGYAAGDDPSDNRILFGLKGLFGGYPEALSMMPYFSQLAEYHNLENRDVWEYELNLTPGQIDQLLNHIWEMTTADITYYFLNKNCAYHLWALLEVANPEWHITDHFKQWAIPADGIKELARIPGAVKQVNFRPSIYHRLKQKVLAMSPQENKSFETSRRKNLLLNHDESGLVLEGLLDYQQFNIHPFNRDLTKEEQAKQKELFLQLATAPQVEAELPPLERKSQPDLGHSSRKISTYAGDGSQKSYFGIELRPSFHDLLDYDEGYTAFSQFDVVKVDLRYSRLQNVFGLEDLELLNVVSLTPVDSLIREQSWMIDVGGYVPPDSPCQNCFSGRLQGGKGYSAYLLPRAENLIAYAFLKANLEGGAGTVGGFRWGPSEWIGLDMRLLGSLKLLTDFEYFQFLNSHFVSNGGPDLRWKSGVSWYAARNFEIRVTSEYDAFSKVDSHFGRLMLGYYF